MLLWDVPFGLGEGVQYRIVQKGQGWVMLIHESDARYL